MRWGYGIVLLVQFYGLGFIHTRPNWWMIEIKGIAQWLEVQFSSNLPKFDPWDLSPTCAGTLAPIKSLKGPGTLAGEKKKSKFLPITGSNVIGYVLYRWMWLAQALGGRYHCWLGPNTVGTEYSGHLGDRKRQRNRCLYILQSSIPNKILFNKHPPKK